MTVVVNSVREVSVMLIGVTRLRVNIPKLSFLAPLSDCEKGGPGTIRDEAARFSFLMESILSSNGLRSLILLVMLCKRVSKSTLIMQVS